MGPLIDWTVRICSSVRSPTCWMPSCARQGRDAPLAGIETEARRQGVHRGTQKGDGGVQRLTQVRSNIELAQPEGCGGNGMAQTEQEEDGLEVHGATEKWDTPPIPARNAAT
jgi:hypothetical protein